MKRPMRNPILAVSCLAIAVGAAPAAACDGKAEVEAAFVEQQKQSWRTEVLTKSPDGADQHQHVDFQPPDKIYRKATVGEESIETIGIGKTAWNHIESDGGWQELPAMHARVVTLQIQEAFAPPRVTADFNCLGTVTYDGKSFRAYQTTPEKIGSGEMLARTIYVDPETGRPAFNIVGTPDGSSDPIVKSIYTYPSDIKIESPL